MNTSQKRIRFPLWKYLNQRIFDKETPIFFFPHQYWHFYQCQHLEKCWFINYQPEHGPRN